MSVSTELPVEQVEMTKAEKKAKKKAAKRATEEVEQEEPIVEKKAKKSKKSSEEAAVEEEPASTEQEGEKKKKKKSKKSEAVVAEEDEETAAPTESAAEPATKKKKSKKNKAAEDDVNEEEAEAVEEPPKKKSKKEKKTEEEAAPSPSEEKEEEETAAPTTGGKGDEDEQKNVIVFGLPFSADEETVKKDFAECGEITSFRMPTNRETGQPKGMAFIDFATAEGAKKALAYHETDYGGRTLNVRYCEPDGAQGKGGKGKDGKKGKGKGKDGKGKGKGPGEKPDGCTSLVVKFLAQETTEDKLWTLFEDVAPSKIKLLTDRDSGESKCVAFVDFEDGSKLEEAVKKNNSELDGKTIFVSYNAPKGEGKGDGKKGGGKDGKGKGKGKKGKGKKGGPEDAAKAANAGKIDAESQGPIQTFDSDSE